MNFKRIGRILVCLVLVCALIVQISPIKAEATSAILPVLVKYSAEAIGIIAASAVALGLADAYHDDMGDAFEQLQNELVDYYTQQGVINSDGYIDVYSLGNGMYGLDAALLQGMFDWMFDSGVVVDNTLQAVSSASIVIDGIPFELFLGEPTYVYFAYGTYGSGKYYGSVVINSIDHSVTWRAVIDGFNRGWDKTTYSSTYGSYFSWLEGGVDVCSGIPSYNVGHFSTQSELMRAFLDISLLNSDSISTAYDLTLGEIAPAGSTLADGYKTWASNSVVGTNAAGEAITVFPLGTAKLGDEELVYTQEQVQTGTVPFVIIVDQTGTGGDGTEPTEPGNENDKPILDVPLLERLFGGIENKLDLTYTSIQEIPELLKEFMSDVKTGFLELPGKFAEWFTKLQTTLEQLLSGQITLGDLLSGLIEPVRVAITDALTALFVPSETFIPTKVQELTTKYGHLETFLALGTDLRAFFASLGAQPPIIYIDLGAGSGFYPMGGKTVFVDLTWYAEYKGTVDAILGGLIWLWLVWRVFMSVPGIISGQSGVWGLPKNDIGEKSTALTIPEWRRG